MLAFFMVGVHNDISESLINKDNNHEIVCHFPYIAPRWLL